MRCLSPLLVASFLRMVPPTLPCRCVPITQPLGLFAGSPCPLSAPLWKRGALAPGDVKMKLSPSPAELDLCSCRMLSSLCLFLPRYVAQCLLGGSGFPRPEENSCS